MHKLRKRTGGQRRKARKMVFCSPASIEQKLRYRVKNSKSRVGERSE